MTDEKKLKILCVPANEGGCSYYRIIAPMRKLEELHGDKVEIRWDKNPLGIDEKTGKWKENWEFENMKWADIVFTQNLSNFGGPYTARIVGKAKEFGCFVHYDTDDLLTNIYEGHRLYKVYKEKGLEEIAAFIYSHADLVTVTQSRFAERVKPYIGKGNSLAIVKNTIDYNLPCWNMPKTQVKKKNYTRFGWVGGIHHEQDLKYFSGVPHLVNQRVGRENCQWDFYGHPPPGNTDWQTDVWTKYKSIILRGFKGGKNWNIHHAMQADRYGQFYTNMDVALAPLEMNNFNDSKSEIKVAECGRYKIPLVASNVGCYDEWIKDGETGFLIDPKRGISEWVRILTLCAKKPDMVKRMGENLHQLTEENFDMNKRAGDRITLYEEVMKRESKDS
tara:strand:+ start:3520 stop:4689 length:1170 start_codon:yes stop_codon:yes gene_type:complete